MFGRSFSFSCSYVPFKNRTIKNVGVYLRQLSTCTVHNYLPLHKCAPEQNTRLPNRSAFLNGVMSESELTTIALSVKHIHFKMLLSGHNKVWGLNITNAFLRPYAYSCPEQNSNLGPSVYPYLNLR